MLSDFDWLSMGYRGAAEACAGTTFPHVEPSL
jgi:hypothetical protein